MFQPPRFLRHTIFLIAALFIAACSPSAPTFKGTDISGVDWGGDVELTAHTGQRVKISDFSAAAPATAPGVALPPASMQSPGAVLGRYSRRDSTASVPGGVPPPSLESHGKVVILFFGYTHCPDICAPTLTRLAQLRKQLGEDGRRVQVVFITVDPKHDTVAQLAGFVPKFDPAFIGLTGSDQEIAAVARDYKVAFASNPQSPTFVDHSSSLMVKDAQGKLRLLFRNDMAVEDMAHDVRRLLREQR
jgi:protein SCO1/2